jgi:membrane protein DedA with SNARE-associated domain/rhodanese-related sulfurtransferase
MSEILEFLVRHGYWLLFAWVFVEQAGLPIPAGPLLLAAGALAGTHRMNPLAALALAIAAATTSDFAWYLLGRWRGVGVLKLICRISLEPDSCVRKTQTTFARRGARALIVAKFVPGLNSVAAPLSGISRMRWQRFVAFDGLGAILWTTAYIGAGYLFSGELERVAAHLAFLGSGLFVVLLAALAGYIGFKFFNRRRFLKTLRIARITAEDLKRRMDAGEDVVVVDLRSALEVEAEPDTIPGAVRMDAADLEEAFEVIPRDREIVVFCSCPNEATSARVALRLRALGITQIRPLADGLAAWRRHGFPLQAPKQEEINSGDART